MTTRAIAIAGLLLAVVSLGAAGCSSAPRITRPDVTGGRHLELFVSSAGRRFERYRVTPDGLLHFGGGAAAQSSNFTWSGPLTEDEIDRLFGAIERDGWFRDDPPSTGQPPDTLFNVQIRGPAGRNSFRATGETETLAQVHQLLAQAARRRLEGDLDALPQPGERR